MNPDAEKWAGIMAEFDQGADVPAVDGSVMKQFVEAAAKLMAESPPNPNVAMGMGGYARHGFNPSSCGPEDFVAVWMRQNFLSALIQRGVLQDYMRDEDSREKVYAAAATFPFNKEGMAEALVQLHLSQSPAEVAAKIREELKQNGYDVDHPAIDGKFIAWMQEH